MYEYQTKYYKIIYYYLYTYVMCHVNHYSEVCSFLYTI